jgi:sugar/nucleoside kinase (ribokinase family)
MHIATLGDVMLDIIVEAPDGLREDDDTEARIELSAGGQAANVAAWAVSLGARGTVVGPHGSTSAAAFIADQLSRASVDVVSIAVTTTGKVVSIVASGTRTLASDAGDQSWANRLDPNALSDDVDWLHVSGYPLLRASDPVPLLSFVAAVRRRGAAVSLDLSSAGLITSYGADRFSRVLAELAPELVFANASEWEALGLDPRRAAFDLVIKRGAAGATTFSAGASRDHPAPAAEVVDLTGAGDALAAGYLVGGIDLALQTAARCVRQRGAQPSSP